MYENAWHPIICGPKSSEKKTRENNQRKRKEKKRKRRNNIHTQKERDDCRRIKEEKKRTEILQVDVPFIEALQFLSPCFLLSICVV